MQTLHYQNGNSIIPSVMINRAQPTPEDKHEQIRDAVRAWASAIDNQDVVSALIINEYREQGGIDITFPEDISRARQKLFRFLDNRFGSDLYRENVRQLTPAIMAVLPLEFRGKLTPADDVMSRISAAMKECMEAKQAVMLGAPEHQKMKEVSEGIASLFRLMPDQVGPLMTMVTSMLGVM
ncbi:regulatory protein CII from bacteriophage origin [Enterobacter hormaechei]|uniref:toxin YdaT domain-containing protein n=1 Tax=Enterobacter hormaechei TaxID=158836 RepID=UPI0007945B79|nr:toxin YdaT domain-containing protein [Enterobacter hormaechei]CZY67677.1 regulatory protein CII from bacteriophage origin [Enterobacter hormaechei]